MTTKAGESRVDGGALFLEAMANVDPTTNHQARLLVDTNVVIDFMSFCDLLKEGDKHRDVLELMMFGDFSSEEDHRQRSAAAAWRSPQHRHRQLRAKAAIILMWVLAERHISSAMLGKEVIDILNRSSPIPCAQPNSLLPDGNAYAFTTVVVHAIHPMLISRGLQLGALTEVNHAARGNKADAELLRLAKRDSLPIVSNEGYTVHGVSDLKSNGDKSLRGLARAIGVRVYTPTEYLRRLHIRTEREAPLFLQACERPLIEEYLRTEGHRSWLLERLDKCLSRVVESTGYVAFLEQLFPLYRFILLDERDEALEDIPPPAAH